MNNTINPETKLTKQINEYIAKNYKGKVLLRAKEIVIPSLQNFKTEPKLFFSPKNMKSLDKLFNSKHVKCK